MTATWRTIELTPYRNLVGAGTADVVMTANALNGQIDARTRRVCRQDAGQAAARTLGCNGAPSPMTRRRRNQRFIFGADAALRLATQRGQRPAPAREYRDYQPARCRQPGGQHHRSQARADRHPGAIASAALRVAALLAHLNGPRAKPSGRTPERRRPPQDRSSRRQRRQARRWLPPPHSARRVRVVDGRDAGGEAAQPEGHRQLRTLARQRAGGPDCAGPLLRRCAGPPRPCGAGWQIGRRAEMAGAGVV